MKPCFFCDVQKGTKGEILRNSLFFSRFDDFPVSKGHCEVISKKHVASFFDLTSQEVLSFFELLNKTREIIQKQFSPDGFNLGMNQGKAAGESIGHFHCHLIPRYVGDVANAEGGIRNAFPNGNYTFDAKQNNALRKYLA